MRGLSLHLERLRQNSRALFGRAVDDESIIAQLRTMLEAATGPALVRVTVYAETALPSGSPSVAAPHVLITARQPEPARDAQLRVKSVEHERFLPAVKHVATLPQLLLRRRAQAEGFDDVLLLDAQRHVLEGSAWNVVFVKGRSAIWPVGAMLRGVVMQLVVERLTSLGFDAVERSVAREEIGFFRAAFATDSQFGVRAIAAVDDLRYEPDPELLHLMRRSYELAPLETI